MVIQNIGFFGGHSVYDIGTSDEMRLFFLCIKKYANLSLPEQQLLDRLRRRYVRQDALELSLSLMTKIRNELLQVRSAQVEWESFGFDQDKTELPLNAWTLADVFSKYFTTFEEAVDSAQSFFDKFKIYQAVRIVRYDLAGFVTDKERPLEQYDRLEGEPLWLG